MAYLKPTAKSALVAYALSAFIVGGCFAHGDIELRIEGATRQIDAEPSNPEAYLRRSGLHREHRNWAAAEGDIAVAQTLDPASPDLLYHRGLLLRDKGDLASAADLLRRFLDSDFDANPSAVPPSKAHAELALILADLGQWRSAADQVSLAIRHANQPGPQLYVSRAEFLAKTGDPDWADEALRGLDEGIARLGTGSILPDYAIDIEVSRGNFDAAVARIERRLQAPGYRLQASLKKAEVLEMAGREEAALSAYADASRALLALPVRVQSTFAVRRLTERVDAGILRVESATEGSVLDFIPE